MLLTYTEALSGRTPFSFRHIARLAALTALVGGVPAGAATLNPDNAMQATPASQALAIVPPGTLQAGPVQRSKGHPLVKPAVPDITTPGVSTVTPAISEAAAIRPSTGAGGVR